MKTDFLPVVLSVDEKNKLLQAYMPIVRIILSKMYHKLPKHADFDELYSSGLLGLVEAVHKYDPSKGYAFDTYASFRVRGAILDALRQLDYMTRTSRQKSKSLDVAQSTLEQKMGRKPSDADLAHYLNIDNQKLRKLRQQTIPLSFVSLQTPLDEADTIMDYIPDESLMVASDSLEAREKTEALRKGIQQLNYRERKILELYYFEQLKLNEISRLLGLSEARVSQIRKQALMNLKSTLQF